MKNNHYVISLVIALGNEGKWLIQKKKKKLMQKKKKADSKRQMQKIDEKN